MLHFDFHLHRKSPKNFHISEWQKEEVLKRQSDIKNHPESLVDFDEMMTSLEKELESES